MLICDCDLLENEVFSFVNPTVPYHLAFNAEWRLALAIYWTSIKYTAVAIVYEIQSDLYQSDTLFVALFHVFVTETYIVVTIALLL